METPITYQTRSDFIAQEVNTAFGPEIVFFDTEAIADEMAVWHAEIDEHGNEWVQNSGYRLREEFVDNPDGFWELAQRHEHTFTAKRLGHNDHFDAEEIAIYRDGKLFDTALAEDGEDLTHAVFEQLGSSDGEFTWDN